MSAKQEISGTASMMSASTSPGCRPPSKRARKAVSERASASAVAAACIVETPRAPAARWSSGGERDGAACLLQVRRRLVVRHLEGAPRVHAQRAARVQQQHLRRAARRHAAPSTRGAARGAPWAGACSARACSSRRAASTASSTPPCPPRSCGGHKQRSSRSLGSPRPRRELRPARSANVRRARCRCAASERGGARRGVLGDGGAELLARDVLHADGIEAHLLEHAHAAVRRRVQLLARARRHRVAVALAHARRAAAPRPTPPAGSRRG
eukprot:scaffold546_cov352-Prasinococcus_capsulatus_cf.AAC.7